MSCAEILAVASQALDASIEEKLLGTEILLQDKGATEEEIRSAMAWLRLDFQRIKREAMFAIAADLANPAFPRAINSLDRPI